MIQFVIAGALSLAVVHCAHAGDAIGLDEYRHRRAALRKSLDGAVLLFGATESETGNVRTGFMQETNFLYLTGWEEQGAALLLTPSEEILFLPNRDEKREIYTGAKTTAATPGIASRIGIDTVVSVEELEKRVRALEPGTKLYTLRDSFRPKQFDKLAGSRESHDAGAAIARLRMKKSPAEISLLQYAVDSTIAAHRAAWRRIHAGLSEYQVAATMLATYLEAGCERSAYSPIVASGPNAVVLHYSRNTRRMDRGELVLMDVGAECASYAADITRTVPVGGRFTQRQREIYEIVLGAQKAAIAAVRPGVPLREGNDSIHQVALDYINQHGKDSHGEPLGKYFTHGIGHHLGLDVHDARDPKLPLDAGNVITVEPGIYIPEENIGIRIEDVILVTETGAKVLSAALPSSAAEVEKALRR